MHQVYRATREQQHARRRRAGDGQRFRDGGGQRKKDELARCSGVTNADMTIFGFF
jgi:hypothetical protein